MIVGFTGSRVGMTQIQKIKFKNYLKDIKIEEFRHGDCVGADKDAHDIVSKLGIPIVIHPPENDKMRAFCKGAQVLEAKSYLKRDDDIVNASHLIIVCPATMKEEKRSGTWYTFRKARKKEKKVLIIWPNGGCRYENYGKQQYLF